MRCLRKSRPYGSRTLNHSPQGSPANGCSADWLSMGSYLLKGRRDGSDLLVEHCLALDFPPPRPPVHDRLVAALGSELARRLVVALTRPRD